MLLLIIQSCAGLAVVASQFHQCMDLVQELKTVDELAGAPGKPSKSMGDNITPWSRRASSTSQIDPTSPG
jgi:hypothetical protein